MLKLKDFFQNIALGELSGSPYVDVDSYEIDIKHLPKVIHSLNQGLEYFYSNFPLKTNQVIIERKSELSLYFLDSMYAYSNPDNKIKFIVDTPEKPFEDDVLQITEVRTSSGSTLLLNDDLSYTSVHTPEYNCIRVPDAVMDKHLIVIYQANHRKVPLTEPRNSNFLINIPSSYQTALQTYVACLMYQNMGGKNIEISNALFAKFKTLTEELKLQGIGTVTQAETNIKPMLRGWV